MDKLDNIVKVKSNAKNQRCYNVWQSSYQCNSRICQQCVATYFSRSKDLGLEGLAV